MKAALIFALSVTVAPASADQLLMMPNGGTCWQNERGLVWGCSEDASGPKLSPQERRDAREAVQAQKEAAQAQKMQAQNEARRQEELKSCLRKADWPKMPGREECHQMWGN